MTRGSSTLAALVLCVAGLCVVGAASASATVGLTAVECEEVVPGTGRFNTSHCETPETVGNSETVAFPLNVSKEIEGDAVGTTVFHMTVALSATTVTCTKAHFTGKVTNVTPSGSGAEMQAHATEVVTKYSECEAHLSVKTGTEEACQIESISGTAGQKGVIETTKMTWTTGPEHKLTFKHEGEATALMEFNVLAEKATGVPCSLPKSKTTITGEYTGQASTTKHSHITLSGEGALKANGAAATLTSTTVTYTKGNPERTVGLTTIS